MVQYHAYIDEFKKFMAFFRASFPELYNKYAAHIAMPKKGMTKLHIKRRSGISIQGRDHLNYIISRFYSIQWN